MKWVGGKYSLSPRCCAGSPGGELGAGAELYVRCVYRRTDVQMRLHPGCRWLTEKTGAWSLPSFSSPGLLCGWGVRAGVANGSAFSPPSGKGNAWSSRHFETDSLTKSDLQQGPWSCSCPLSMSLLGTHWVVGSVLDTGDSASKKDTVLARILNHIWSWRSFSRLTLDRGSKNTFLKVLKDH